MVCVASLRRVCLVTTVALIAGALSGCKTTGAVDTTGSISSGAPARSDADWRGDTQALGEKFRADPRDPDTAIRYARAKGYTRVYGHARVDLVPFWQAFGFRVIEGRPKFQFSDVEYVEMAGELSKAANPVSIGDCPYRMIRPEGRWEEPGPLERIQNVARSSRIAWQFRQAA